MEIYEVKTDKYDRNLFVPSVVYNKIVNKGLKSEIGKCLGFVLNLTIVNKFEKNVQYETSTRREKVNYAEYLCGLTSKKRNLDWSKYVTTAIALTDTELNTLAEQRNINNQLDAEVDYLYKKLKVNLVTNASDVIIRGVSNK